MPSRQHYVEPEIALERGEVKIYHCYDEGEADNKLTYWFALNDHEDVEDSFDVRDLKSWFPEPLRAEIKRYPRGEHSAEHILDVLRRAIDLEELG